MTAWDAERWHAATGELDRMLGQSAGERAAALDVLRARDPGWPTTSPHCCATTTRRRPAASSSRVPTRS